MSLANHWHGPHTGAINKLVHLHVRVKTIGLDLPRDHGFQKFASCEGLKSFEAMQTSLTFLLTQMHATSTAGSVEFDRRPRNAKQQGMGDAGGQSVESSGAAHILSLRS